MIVLDEIAAERSRQIDGEGWSLEHDDSLDGGELALAAACYAANNRHLGYQAFHQGRSFFINVWPFDDEWWKPKDRRRDLIRAAALLVSEIERIDRMQP